MQVPTANVPQTTSCGWNPWQQAFHEVYSWIERNWRNMEARIRTASNMLSFNSFVKQQLGKNCQRLDAHLCPTCKHSATGAQAPGLERSHFDAVEFARDTPETKSPLLGAQSSEVHRPFYFAVAHVPRKDKGCKFCFLGQESRSIKSIFLGCQNLWTNFPVSMQCEARHWLLAAASLFWPLHMAGLTCESVWSCSKGVPSHMPPLSWITAQQSSNGTMTTRQGHRWMKHHLDVKNRHGKSHALD